MNHAKLALSFLICYSAGAAAENAWKTDSVTGCKAWAEKSSPSIRWEGECNNGYASGKGVLHTLPPSQGRYEGEMVKGKLNGPVKGITYPIKDYHPIKDYQKYDVDVVEIEGNYKEGIPVGKHKHTGISIIKESYAVEGSVISEVVHDYRKGTPSKVGMITGPIQVAGDAKNSGQKTDQQGSFVSGVIDDGKGTNYEYQGGNLKRKVSVIKRDGWHDNSDREEYEENKLIRKVYHQDYVKSYTGQKEEIETTYLYRDGKLSQTKYAMAGAYPKELVMEYEDGKLARLALKSNERLLKYDYQDGKLIRSSSYAREGEPQQHAMVRNYRPVVKEGRLSYEEIKAPPAVPPKVAERKTPPPQESVVAEESSEDSGIGGFLGGLLGAVSQYQQARGNTVKASQAEVLSAALSGDEKKAEAATSKLQSLAEAERARKAKEQADKVAAQEAAQLRAMQAAADRNSATSSSSYGGYSSADSSGGSDPSQNYPTQQQPTYSSSNTSSSGKRTTVAPRPVIDVQVISYGSKTSYGKLKHFVKARNAGNVNVSCYVVINWAYSSAIYGDKRDSTAGHLRLRPGQTDEFVIEGENAHYRSWFEKYSLRDCRQS